MFLKVLEPRSSHKIADDLNLLDMHGDLRDIPSHWDASGIVPTSSNLIRKSEAIWSDVVGCLLMF